MIHIKIKSWDKEKAWTNWGGHYKKQFVNRVRERTNISNTEIKRLSKEVFSEKPALIILDRITDKSEASGICHLLESMGANFEILEA